MKLAERADLFERIRARYIGFLASVLWKLTGDRELFAEAMQYSLLGMWQNIEKLKGKKAGAYIYRIALTANSRAWRNRIGKDGQFTRSKIAPYKKPGEKLDIKELTSLVRREISHLPARQARAIVMRYLEQQDYKDIAGKLRCTEAGARSHVSKAIATLKKNLAALREEVQ
jgi:RNA polymerase sigma factor (sigma-70 family)